MRLTIPTSLALLLASPFIASADTVCRKVHSDLLGSAARGLSTPAFVISRDCSKTSLQFRARSPKVALQWNTDHPPLQIETSTVGNGLPPLEAIPSENSAAGLPAVVLFTLDNSDLAPSARPLLDEIDPESRVAVFGYACDLGPSPHNLRLSQKRAETVAAYLRERGVRVVTVEGMGECCPVSSQQERNRRVEIHLKKEKNRR